MIDGTKGDWLAVYIGPDGPFVVGPFEWEKDAHYNILHFYVERYGETLSEADARYAESGNEWVTRLHGPNE